jgi:succinoglycan biosynthesis protein ExoV
MEQCFDDETLFLGIGSILNRKIPEYPAKKVVFGSGFGYGSPPSITDRWRFYCVRGPLTAKMLGLPASTAICDGAVLIRELVEPAQRAEHKVAFMPHHLTAKYDDWKSVCESLSICYIDPAASIESTLDAIRQSSVVITEAMHGAIVADALRVPWIPVRTRPRILEFKWQDWSSSIRLEHKFEWLPPIWNRNSHSRLRQTLHPIASPIARERLRWLARHGKRRLSRETIFRQVYCHLSEAFNELVAAAQVPNRTNGIPQSDV